MSANYSCGTSTALLSWTESLGRESFSVRVETSNHSDSCSTAQTHCSINTLRCGSLYNVSVESVSGYCNSSNAAHTQLQTGEHAFMQDSPKKTLANLLLIIYLYLDLHSFYCLLAFSKLLASKPVIYFFMTIFHSLFFLCCTFKISMNVPLLHMKLVSVNV